MSKTFTEMPGESSDRGTAQIAKPVRQAENVAEHRAGYHRMGRAGYIAGAVVAVAAVIGIFLVTVLPTLAPQAPASVQPVVTSGLGPDDLRRIARDAQVTQATAPGPMPASLEGPSAIAAANPVLMPAPIDAYRESTTQRAIPSQTQPSAQTAPGFVPVAPEPAPPPDWLMGTASQRAPRGINAAGSVTSTH